MNPCCIYVVFTATPYRIGRMIRLITGGAFNHVSVALDANLNRMYSFARRNYHYPLYGGFVREYHARYHPKGQASNCEICRLPVTQAQYDRIALLLQDMEEQPDRYLYNHLSVLTSPFRRAVPVRDAYLCVEFVVHILSQLDYGISEGTYYSVTSLAKQLSSYSCYTGPFPQGASDPDYFRRDAVSQPIRTSIKSIVALLPRINRNR